MAGKWRKLREILQRKRIFDPEQLEVGNLRRCLNRWDLTALGLGSTLGVGVYVLIGYVALKLAGPSIVLSFLIAAVASLFAGLCYAELGSRVPRAGSAYIYTYATVGEFAAFIIGWNIILECVFGTASVARGLSVYVDLMVNNTMSAWFTSAVPITSPHLSPYFDFFSLSVVIVLGVVLAVGVRESAIVNNVFAIINMATILFIIMFGAFRADASNWSIPASEVSNHGVGGFFPYGVWGTLKGAAVCFYGFVGFDSISSTGEEVHEPRRTIPFAILTVLLTAFVTYASVSIVITMMMPYYLQEVVASVATAFTYVGWDWARWIVSIGAIFGISASMFGAMFPLPRLLYAMASDGLFFHWFANLSPNRKSPVLGTLVPAVIIAILAAIFELEQLVLMMCIGTLLSYTIVAVSVILLRYDSDNNSAASPGYIKQMFGLGHKSPSEITSRVVTVTLSFYICTCLVSALLTVYLETPFIPAVILNVLCLILIIIMTLQPMTKEELSFKTPLVPIVPCLSIYVNIHLMILINVQTWIRIAIWIAIGIPVYIICVCCYKRQNKLEDNMKMYSHAEKNGKTPLQIIVQSPTPPGTIRIVSNNGGDRSVDTESSYVKTENEANRDDVIVKTEEVIVQQAVVENNEEKEAKIIDLLDQVLQAEEDSYGEILSLHEEEENSCIVSTVPEPIPHRKSLSELSDAESEASLGNQVLSKYDVIAQVHREDLSKVKEEEEKNENEDVEKNNEESENVVVENSEIIIKEQDTQSITLSETNSRTDESGYSDTIEKTELNDSTEDLNEDKPNIPIPPPLDENFFANSNFKKSYSLAVRPRIKSTESEEENGPRESVKSSTSQDDGNIIFGSDRQMNFMSKLNVIYQNKITNTNDGPVQRQRSHSFGNEAEDTKLTVSQERPIMFLDLQKEIMSREASQNLRPVKLEDKNLEVSENEDDDSSLSRNDLKLKLEGIFASGGPTLLKPRLMKSNPPTPEEAYQTDTGSSESIAKLPKMDKNDTLKRQKDKFSAVLSSFQKNFSKEDHV